MVGFELERHLLQIVLHISDIAQEIARNQLFRAIFIVSVLDADGVVADFLILLLHGEVEGAVRVEKVLLFCILLNRHGCDWLGNITRFDLSLRLLNLVEGLLLRVG